MVGHRAALDLERKRRQVTGAMPSSRRKRSEAVSSSASAAASGNPPVDESEYPPRYTSLGKAGSATTGLDADTFLTEGHPDFARCLATSYGGFVVERSTDDDRSKSSVRQDTRLRQVLATLDQHRAFQHDVIQPLGLGTPCTETKVARTLIGDAGITYKYLNLRIFAHPWSEDPGGAEEAEGDMRSACAGLRQLNGKLAKRARRHLHRQGLGGSAAYNVVLINRARPLSEISDDLKTDPLFNMGKVAVSWHADSSLQHESTIGVCIAHHGGEGFATDRGSVILPEASSAQGESSRARRCADSHLPWRVGLRVLRDIEGPRILGFKDPKRAQSHLRDDYTPPVAVDVRDGDVYFMLGNFNHHHQVGLPAPRWHAVWCLTCGRGCTYTHPLADAGCRARPMSAACGAYRRSRLAVQQHPSRCRDRGPHICVDQDPLQGRACRQRGCGSVVGGAVEDGAASAKRSGV